MTPGAHIALTLDLHTNFLKIAEDYLSPQEHELLALSAGISQKFTTAIHEFLATNFPQPQEAPNAPSPIPEDSEVDRDGLLARSPTAPETPRTSVSRENPNSTKEP